MVFADVHAHLDLLQDIESAVERAKKAGVISIIQNSVSIKSNYTTVEIAKKYDIVKAALGLYPIDAISASGEEFDNLMKFIQKQDFIAFGEIGLDYEETNERKIQQERFIEQIQLAKSLGKPVIVHSRKAEVDVVETLIDNGCKKAVLHAFHGNMKLVKRAAEEGCCFSIPSNITRSTSFQKMAEILPIESILTETDTPYLGPGNDKRSEPSFVKGTVAEIAKIRKISENEAEEAITANYRRIFQ